MFKVRSFILSGFIRYLYMVITVVKLLTVRLSAKLACLVKLALASPFSIFYMHLYVGEPVVAFCPTNAFWTKSTKIILSSDVPKSNMGIVITYLPEVLSPEALRHI